MASEAETSIEFWVFLLGCCSIQKFGVKMNFVDSLVIQKLEIHYPKMPASANVPKSKIIDEL